MKTLLHNGVYFPPDYERLPKTIYLKYDGKQVELNEQAEEAAVLYARYVGTAYLDNPTFVRNFWEDWKLMLKDTPIKSITKCDFSKIHNYLEKKKEKRKNYTKEKKQKLKEQRDATLEPYRWCFVDGEKQPVESFIIEPPGLFMGRGKHPLAGKIKHRILPRDITLNLSRRAPHPKPNVPGRWGGIINDMQGLWIARWKAPITNKMKYVFLARSSKQRSSRDVQKYEKARKLKKKINKIRKQYTNEMQSSDKRTKMIACAVYLIDRLALRVGNEKSEDQADTVGATSLRVEHIHLQANNYIKLDFLGKDSVRYVNRVKVEPIVWINLKEFIKDKSSNHDIFDVSSGDINEYLHKHMKDLTAKVFRTYNASHVLQIELKKLEPKFRKIHSQELSERQRHTEMVRHYNTACRKVAELCNHQKDVAKGHGDAIEKMQDRMKDLKKKLEQATEKKAPAIEKRINELKQRIKEKNLNKNITLTTSRANYIDPRITVSFFKRHDIPIEKVFSKTLLKNFDWSLNTNQGYEF
uniref:DNA topoisomerase 1 n=1 Tax=Megaviridae environmental sample TaxID=1737588 RepID=A0A5J6VJR3_9VIRU|nr:MAG: DNA topoisomerase I-like protein [Megaviridae environmental sample]